MVDGGEQTQGVIFFIGNRRPTDRELREIPVSLLRTVEDVQEFNAWVAEVRRGEILFNAIIWDGVEISTLL